MYVAAAGNRMYGLGYQQYVQGKACVARRVREMRPTYPPTPSTS